eukprot:1160615-Pelagomonas_calceolata.AAC.4
MPAQDRDVHLVELTYCPDTIPLPSLKKAADQHAGTISRLRTRSLRNPTEIINWALPDVTQKKLASQLSCHALRSLTKTINTRHTLYLQGSLGRGGTGGQAVQSRRRRVHARRGMAESNPPDPH